jgi:TolB-like protein
MLKTTILSLLMVLILNGCKQEPIYIPTPQKEIDQKLLISKKLSNSLSKNLKIDLKGTIIITSLVNLNNFKETSNFGRAISEDLFNELFQLGFNIREIRGSNNIFVNKKGEFNLSRNIDVLKSEIPNTYILVGTYSTINDYLYINIRLIDNNNGGIVSTASLKIKDNFNLNSDIVKKSIKLTRL